MEPSVARSLFRVVVKNVVIGVKVGTQDVARIDGGGTRRSILFWEVCFKLALTHGLAHMPQVELEFSCDIEVAVTTLAHRLLSR